MMEPTRRSAMQRIAMGTIGSAAIGGRDCFAELGEQNEAAARTDHDIEPAAAKRVQLDGEAIVWAKIAKSVLQVELADATFDEVVAFRTTSGRIKTILPTISGLFFYRDPKVRGRPMRILARAFENADVIEVIDRFSLVDGKPYEVYYWCEICSIKMHFSQQCECCQGPVELREHPVGEKYVPRNE